MPPTRALDEAGAPTQELDFFRVAPLVRAFALSAVTGDSLSRSSRFGALTPASGGGGGFGARDAVGRALAELEEPLEVVDHASGAAALDDRRVEGDGGVDLGEREPGESV